MLSTANSRHAEPQAKHLALHPPRAMLADDNSGCARGHGLNHEDHEGHEELEETWILFVLFVV